MGWSVHNVMPRRDGPENLRILKKSQLKVDIGPWSRVVGDSAIESKSWVFRIFTGRDELRSKTPRDVLNVVGVVSIVWLRRTFKNCVSLLVKQRPKWRLISSTSFCSPTTVQRTLLPKPINKTVFENFSMAWNNFGQTISTKKDRSDASASAWKTIRRAQHHHQRTTIEGGRKVHLPWQHPLKVFCHGWRGEHQTRKTECSLWPIQQECLESERHLEGNQNQGIPNCHSYHPPLWLCNEDNLSTAYKEAKPLLYNLFEEDPRHHMAKIHSRHRSFNLGFSS